MKIFLLALVALVSVLFNINKPLAIILLMLFLLLICLNRKGITAKESIIFIVAFLAFFIRTNIFVANNISKLENNENINLNIKLIDKININGDYLKTIGYVENEEVNITYKLKNEEEKEYFKNNFKGGMVNARSTISDIEEKNNFYSFDYKSYCKYKGIFKNVKIEEISGINNKVDAIYDKLKLFRTRAIYYIENNIKFDKQGYFEALIFGERSNILIDDKNNFSNLGINHLLAISGLHIASLVAIIYFITKKLGILENIAEKIIFIFLPIYTIFTGLSPSVLRASCMIIIYLLLKKRNIKNVTALLITFIIMLFINPLYVYNLGFQFSFFVTFSLTMSVDFINNSANNLIKSFKISLIAMLASLPISVYNFYTFSYISVLSNLVFVPYFTFLIFPLIIVSYIISLVSIKLFNVICSPLLNTVFLINEKFEELFNKLLFILKVGHINDYISCIIFITIIVILVLLNKRKYKLSILLMAFLLFSLLVIPKINSISKIENLKIANKDVIFARNNNTTFLINTSNNYQDYHKDFRKKKENYDIMNEYKLLLNYEGISNINYLILTKDKVSEIGYAKNLVANKMLDVLLITEQVKNSDKIKEIAELAKFQNIKVEILKNKEKYNIEGVVLENFDKTFKVEFLNKKIEVNKDNS